MSEGWNKASAKAGDLTTRTVLRCEASKGSRGREPATATAAATAAAVRDRARRYGCEGAEDDVVDDHLVLPLPRTGATLREGLVVDVG